MSNVNSIFQTLIYTVKSQMKSRHHLVRKGITVQYIIQTNIICHILLN